KLLAIGPAPQLAPSRRRAIVVGGARVARSPNLAAHRTRNLGSVGAPSGMQRSMARKGELVIDGHAFSNRDIGEALHHALDAPLEHGVELFGGNLSHDDPRGDSVSINGDAQAKAV